MPLEPVQRRRPVCYVRARQVSRHPPSTPGSRHRLAASGSPLRHRGMGLRAREPPHPRAGEASPGRHGPHDGAQPGFPFHARSRNPPTDEPRQGREVPQRHGNTGRLAPPPFREHHAALTPRPLPHPGPSAVDLQVATGEQAVDLYELATQAAAQSLRFAEAVTRSNVSDIELEGLESRITRIATDYVHAPLYSLFQDLLSTRDQLFALLSGHQPPAKPGSCTSSPARVACSLLTRHRISGTRTPLSPNFRRPGPSPSMPTTTISGHGSRAQPH